MSGYIRTTETIPIDKGIEIPPIDNRSLNALGAARMPWDEMEVGDSFFTTKPGAFLNTAKASTRYPGKKFTGRRMDTGWRIWRIK